MFLNQAHWGQLRAIIKTIIKVVKDHNIKNMNPNEAPKVCGGGSCGCGHHKAKPIAVILFAIAWLLTTTGVLTWNVFNIIWPILLILVACTKLCGCKCCQNK